MIHKSASNIEVMKGSLDKKGYVDEYYGAASKACLEYNLFQLEQLERLLCSKSLILSRISYPWLRKSRKSSCLPQ
jgi:hypothetical protein